MYSRNHKLNLLLVFICAAAACSPKPTPTQTLEVISPPTYSSSHLSSSTNKSPTTTTHQPSLSPSPSPHIPTNNPQVHDTLRPETLILDTPSPILQFCSPLQDVSLEELPSTIHNPFHPPRPGSDDPHHGVDYAIQQNGIALTGSPVQSILSGRVAAVINDRFPYGNAVIIETTLDEIPDIWTSQLPTPAPTLQPHPALNCPAPILHVIPQTSERSLYIMYAHLLEPVEFYLGDQVSCGDAIGSIGSSGNALNPHLHVEIRLGPAEATFDSMAHYHTSASPQEIDSYCTWRVREIFQLLNPTTLITEE